MTDLFEELRIIAKDGGKLSSSDCELLDRAADQLEGTLIALIEVQAKLIEANSHRIALNDVVLGYMRLQSKPIMSIRCLPLWRVSWGNK